MARQFADPEPFYARYTDAFVMLSVAVLSLALGAWLIARLEFELTSALLAALGAYVSLLLLHLFVRRRMMGSGADVAQGSDWENNAAARRFEAELAQRLAEAEQSGIPQEHEQESAPLRPGEWPEPLPMPETADRFAEQPQAQPLDPFNFRPSRSPYFGADDAPEAHTPQPGMPPQYRAGVAVPEPEMNFEHIQGLIKKLADELNGPPGQESNARATPAAEETAAVSDGMIGRSAAALESAARAMRTPPAEQRAQRSQAGSTSGQVPPWPSARAGGGPARPAAEPHSREAQIARVAEAIAAERMEVMLEPIHALAEGRPRHYEISMRLLTSDGATLEQRDYTRAAVGSGLMPRIDAARMLRAARVARRLSQRGRQGSVLTAMTGESLTGEEFLNAAALQPGTDGRIGLVLSFTQADVRTFTPVHAEALGSMAASGFAFALEDVTDLDMDFGGLKAMGFEFIKLDAEVFLEGLRAPTGRVPAADICRYLSEFGLTLIVGRIEDDWLLARILGFGVLFGKGTLFGGPRLVKAEVVAETGTAAA
jgi:cyclic-di-GMP phosphodiesterase, flagellum assembly factor TipF